MKCSFSDGLPEDCQKTSRRPLAVFWQSSNTMIQGNFYERLHFYMDSCAISPTASLLGSVSLISHKSNNRCIYNHPSTTEKDTLPTGLITSCTLMCLFHSSVESISATMVHTIDNVDLKKSAKDALGTQPIGISAHSLIDSLPSLDLTNTPSGKNIKDV